LFHHPGELLAFQLRAAQSALASFRYLIPAIAGFGSGQQPFLFQAFYPRSHKQGLPCTSLDHIQNVQGSTLAGEQMNRAENLEIAFLERRGIVPSVAVQRTESQLIFPLLHLRFEPQPDAVSDFLDITLRKLRRGLRDRFLHTGLFSLHLVSPESVSISSI